MTNEMSLHLDICLGVVLCRCETWSLSLRGEQSYMVVYCLSCLPLNTGFAG
jgi:hypothetical protein